MTRKFDPDWVIAPSETLKEWMDEMGMFPKAIATAAVGRERSEEALVLVNEVLERKPLTRDHARVLARATGISEQFWLNYEHNYRVGLAAGKKDVSDE